jgi:peptidyl-prolyl cis-trans isomerase D
MLNVFRRLEKTRSLIIIFFAVLLVIGLVVAGVYNRTGVAVANPFRNTEALAEVRGDEITVADYSLRKQLLENQYSQFGGQISLAQLGLTGERMLNDAINNRIAVQEAERLNLLPSDEEVRDQIARDFTAPGGQFDFQRYKDFVTRSFGSVTLFERSVRDQLAAQKLRAFVSAGAQASAQEVQDKYTRENTSFDLVYVPITAQALAEKITPTDEELRQYFEQNSERYRFNVAQKKIRYVFVSQEKAGARLDIPEDELRKEFDALRPENKQAGVRVQQIVLRVARPELDQEVLARATQLVARIRGDDTKATEEEFAEIARGNSEDPATAQNGGYLPNTVRRNPNRRAGQTPGNVGELLQNTLEWEEGFVGDPLKTGNAYYIFRRGASVPKTFEDARQELLVSLRNRKAYGVAQQTARRAAELLRETKDPQQVAQRLAAEANMAPAEMVRETPFVKPQDEVPEIGSSPDFESAIQPLEEQGQIGDPVGIRGGFAVPMLVEKRDPRVPELGEVRDRVARDFREARAKERLEQTARELAANSGSPDALRAAAERLGLKAETEEEFRLGRPLGSLGTDDSLDAAIYALRPGEATKSPVKVADTYGVVAVTARKDADPAEFEKQRSRLMESALEERRSQLFDEFLASTRRRLEADGQIEIHREKLAQLEAADEPASALPRSPLNIPPISDDTK